MKRPTIHWLLALALGAAFTGCGPKRDPEISKKNQGGSTAARNARDSGMTTIDPGPDVQPISNDGASGEFIGGQDGEDGPLADVYFLFDQATLTEASRRTLESHAAWLQTNRSLKVTLEGHCDERGTVDYNLALGDRRAQAVREYLVSLGVGPDRLSAISMGKERPADTSHTETAWAKNRRCHFVVSR